MKAVTTLSLALALIFTSAPLRAQSVPELIKKGDIHYDRLEPAEALKYYLPAEKIEPNNVPLLIRISRQYRHLMSEARKTSEKRRLGEIGVQYAKRAAQLAPNDPEAHLAVAISYGKVLPYLGNKEKMERSRDVKAAAERVLQLDPKNDLGWHVLGRWHVVLADVGAVRRALAKVIYGRFPNATNEDALRCFKKAMELNPNRLMHHIELGRTYAQMGNKEEARKHITKGLSMPNTEKDDPETKQKGREILAKLK